MGLPAEIFVQTESYLSKKLSPLAGGIIGKRDHLGLHADIIVKTENYVSKETLTADIIGKAKRYGSEEPSGLPASAIGGKESSISEEKSLKAAGILSKTFSSEEFRRRFLKPKTDPTLDFLY